MLGLVTSFLCILLFTGCQSKNALEDGTYMMQITSISDDAISGLVSQQKEPNTDEKMGEMPQGEEPPQGEGMPTDNSGMAPTEKEEMPSNAGKDNMMEENGTEATLTINDQTKISQGFMNQDAEEVSLDSLSAGTMVNVVVKNGLATEITIFNREREKDALNGTDSTNESEAANTI